MEGIRAIALAFVLGLPPDAFKSITKEDLTVYVTMTESLMLKIAPCPMENITLPEPGVIVDPSATPDPSLGVWFNRVLSGCLGNHKCGCRHVMQVWRFAHPCPHKFKL